MQSIKKNYIFSVSYQIITIVLPLVTAPYIARVLGPEKIGIDSFLASVEAYFLLFAAMGTAFYGKREVARFRDSREQYSQLFWEIELISITTTSICLVGWFIFSVFQTEYRLFCFILSLNIIAVAFDISWFFAALEYFDKIVLRNLFFKIVSVILLFTIVKKREDLWIYMLINSCSYLFGNASLWIKLRKYVDKPKVNLKSMVNHTKNTMVYFLPTIATTIYTVLDKTMLKMITTDFYQNGYYEQAVKLCRIPLTALLSMDNVMGSRMSYLVEKKAESEIKNRLETSLRLVFFLGIPMVMGLDLVSKKLIPWFFGEEFYPVIKLVYAYSPLVICIGINNCLSEQYLTPIGKRKQTAIIVIISAVMNLILNFLLIPRYQAIGASIASVFSEAFIAIAYVVMTSRIIEIRKYPLFAYKNLIAAVFMVIITMGISYNWKACILSTVLQIIIGGGVYFVVLLGLRDSFLNVVIKTIFIRRRVK